MLSCTGVPPSSTDEQCGEVGTGALVGSVTAIVLALLLSVVAHVVIGMYVMNRRGKTVTESGCVLQEAVYDYIDPTEVQEGKAADLEMRVNKAYGEVRTRAATVEVQPNKAYEQVQTGVSSPAEV